MNERFVNSRGYTAVVIIDHPERVIYNSFDRKGETLQLNNCLPRESFDRQWQRA